MKNVLHIIMSIAFKGVCLFDHREVPAVGTLCCLFVGGRNNIGVGVRA